MKVFFHKFSYLFIFLKIGLYVLGGGYVIQSAIYKELVEDRQLISEEKFDEFLIISNSSPGAVGVNLPFALGYYFHGYWGGILSIIAILFFPLVISFIAVRYLLNFDNRYYSKFIIGVNLGSCAIIFNMSLNLIKKLKKRYFYLFLFFLIFVLEFVFKINNWFIFLGIIVLFIVSLIIKVVKNA